MNGPGPAQIPTAPVQLLVASLRPGADLAPVLAAVDGLQGRGVLRLLDLLVLTRDADGSLTTLSVEETDETDLGSLFTAVAPRDLDALFGLLDDETASHAGALAEDLPPGAAMAFLLVEHRWAGPLLAAVAGAGGSLLAEGFVSDRAQSLVDAETAALDHATRVITAADALEAEAVDQALTAADAADASTLASQAVQDAADLAAVNALVDAGLIEQAAVEEAVEAISRADEAVADSEDRAARAAEVATAAEHRAAEASTAASVTPAGLRVLRHLPTTAPFAVIAAHLGISRSAAKQRAERTYRVLGVHTRADAVERARELRLLPRSTVSPR